MTLLEPLALALTVLSHGTSSEASWITLERELASRPGAGASIEEEAVEAQGGWAFEIRPYLWMAGVRSEISAGTVPPTNANKDIFGDFQPGGFVQFDAMPRDASWGWMFEVLYLSLDAEDAGNEAELKQGFLEADWFWRLPDLPDTDVFIGLRLWDLDVEVSTANPIDSASEKATFLDPVFGARTAIPIGEDWRLRARGDVAGMGLGSNLTWNGYLGMARKIAKSGEIDLGWRFLDLTYDDDFDLAAHYSGPVLGLIWGF